LHNHQADRIRLNGIDCPEKGQAYGNRAKQATSALVFGKAVALQTHGKDKDKRTLADVLLPDGTHVNHMLVKDGWCWWYQKYAREGSMREGLEKDPRARKNCFMAHSRRHPGSGEAKNAKEVQLDRGSTPISRTVELRVVPAVVACRVSAAGADYDTARCSQRYRPGPRLSSGQTADSPSAETAAFVP
jgi:hypothetical protein